MTRARRHSKKKQSRFKNWVVNIILFLLLIIGLALIFNVQIRNFLIQLNGQAYAVDKLTKTEIDKNKHADTTFDFDAVESLSTEAVLRAQFANKNLPVIGGVAVPSVEINLPIFKGLSNIALLTGAGTMKPEQVMGEGNYALASHRVQDMVSLFSPLEYVKSGELVYITDLSDIYTYKINYVDKIEPSRVELIDDVPDKKMITLITCGDLKATTRIAVQGELMDKTPISKAPKEATDAFNLQQRTL